MIVKRDNVERVIPDNQLKLFEKMGFKAIKPKGKKQKEKKLNEMSVDELRMVAVKKQIEGAEALNKEELLKVLGE